MEETEYQAKLSAAGFTGIEIVPTRIYTSKDVQSLRPDLVEVMAEADGKFMSAFVRAVKPPGA
jgi:hypothetical protein